MEAEIKQKRLKLPELWRRGGRRLGSGRDLLVRQMDVIVLGQALDVGEIIQKQITQAGILRDLFIKK